MPRQSVMRWSRSSDGLFNVDWVRSRADGLARLGGTAARSVAAVLADLFLPDSSGLDTFAQLHGAAPQIPLLILIDAQHEAVGPHRPAPGRARLFPEGPLR